MRFSGTLCGVVLSALLLMPVAAAQTDYTGSVKLGYVWLDETGNRSLNQPTFNTYEGVALSLDNYRQYFANGTYVFGELRNITLNNRNLYAGVAQPGRYRLALRSHQYRRVYSADGSDHTKRNLTGGDVWLQPIRSVRLYGGYGTTDKQGMFQELYELGGTPARGEVDWRHRHYHAGARLRHMRSVLELEFRGSDFKDALHAGENRTTARYRASGKSPLPGFERLWLNAGAQHYENRRTGEHDTLSANTFWGGAGYLFPRGFAARYSFAWDQAHRTGDITSTDNILQSVSAEKTWRGEGGVTAGFRYLQSDDAIHDVRESGLFLSGWWLPLHKLTLRADFGMSSASDQDQTTLQGDADLTRFRGAATYRLPGGRFGVKVESRRREWQDIGSIADYTHAGMDLSLGNTRYGKVAASYSYMEGDYTDATNSFIFSDHIFNGQAESASFHGLALMVGGMYLRSRQSIDIERFSVDVGGRYTIWTRYTLEVIYRAHNYDDLRAARQAPVYTDYYTANIVEINLYAKLGS